MSWRERIAGFLRRLDPEVARAERKVDAMIRLALQGEAPQEPAGWEVRARAELEGWK